MAMASFLHLRVVPLSDTYTLYKYPPSNPNIRRLSHVLFDSSSEFYSFSQSPEEVSVLCSSQIIVPDGFTHQKANWKAFKVDGTLDFSLIGILSRISGMLSRADISIFAVSTFNTDYIMVQAQDWERCLACLAANDSAMDPDYKAFHEGFMSGHTGTTAQEILGVSALLPLTLGIYGVGIVAFGSTQRAYITTSLLEGLMIGGPLLLSLTIFAEMPLYFGLALLSIALIGFMAIKSTFQGRFWQSFLHQSFSNDRFLPYLTNYRAGMLFTTAVCILAVDFPMFPRKFAKTESFGFGLMDIGVGSFVFVGGILSPEARKNLVPSSSKFQGMRKALIQSLPLLAIGLLRVVLVKGSGYHEHVSEYGVHWNFFLTLAATKVLSSALFVVIPVNWSWRAALAISLAHESALVVSFYDWVLSDTPRNDLLNANREGIVSSPGYLAIYLAGVAWGQQFARLGNTINDQIDQLKSLVIWSLIMWCSLYYSFQELFRPTSRRFANWNYFNWMVAFNLSLISLFLWADLIILYYQHAKSKIPKGKTKDGKRRITPPQSNNAQVKDAFKWVRVPLFCEAINYNALFHFLLANLFTGLVNFVFKTIDTTTCPSLLILSLYIILLHSISILFYRKKFRMKL